MKKYFLYTRRNELIASTYGIDHLAAIALTKLFRKRKVSGKMLNAILTVPNTLIKVQAILLDGNNPF
ncbi:hypothetical protein KA013_05115 [Patescibacteria group bacterium]|nr:hypothetical protein [Patescibacteria group bacterium]